MFEAKFHKIAYAVSGEMRYIAIRVQFCIECQYLTSVDCNNKLDHLLSKASVNRLLQMN